MAERVAAVLRERYGVRVDAGQQNLGLPSASQDARTKESAQALTNQMPHDVEQ